MKKLEQSIDSAWSIRAAGDSARAEDLLRDAVNALRDDPANEGLMVTALRRLGHTYLDRGAHEEALNVYEEALGICRAGSDVPRLAHMIRHLGDVHRAAGNPDVARSHYHEALDLYRTIDDPPKLDLANAVSMVAISDEASGDSDSAIAGWREARALYKSLNLQEGVDEATDRIQNISTNR